MTQPTGQAPTVNVSTRLGPLPTIAELHGPLAIIADFNVDDHGTITLYEGLVIIVHRATGRCISVQAVCITCARRVISNLIRLPGWHTITSNADFYDWQATRLTDAEKQVFAEFREAEFLCLAEPCGDEDAGYANA